jgi:hypothetical protein
VEPEPFVAALADELDRHFAFVLVVPLALLFKVFVADQAPRVWARRLGSRFTRTPELGGIFQQVLADKRFFRGSVFFAKDGHGAGVFCEA